MANREKIAIGECYHIYNRGVDKRFIFKNRTDLERFFQSLKLFNSKEPVKSLRLASVENGGTDPQPNDKLVEIICYALNLNHFHLLLKEINEGGISEFMKRVSGGYTWYFNNKYKRSGVLFQGKFKSVHIESNEQLLHVSAYINLNREAHKISGSTAVKPISSWGEYIFENNNALCDKEIILGQFKSLGKYRKFAEASLKEILKMKEDRQGTEMLVGKHFY